MPLTEMVVIVAMVASLALLFEKHERPLRSFLARTVGPDAADDIAQEAFIKAWRAAGQYDGRARYSTWLTRIAWRCRLDCLRKERAPQTAYVDGAYTIPT